MKLDIFIHGNITEINTAMTKTAGKISINIPALMQPTMTHYKLHFLCEVQSFPYDRQSSCVTCDIVDLG